MARKDEEYDWLNDPFDDKKNAEVQTGMSSRSKLALIVAVVVVIVMVIVLVALAMSGIGLLV